MQNAKENGDFEVSVLKKLFASGGWGATPQTPQLTALAISLKYTESWFCMMSASFDQRFSEHDSVAPSLGPASHDSEVDVQFDSQL